MVVNPHVNIAILTMDFLKITLTQADFFKLVFEAFGFSLDRNRNLVPDHIHIQPGRMREIRLVCF
jgi:hypothetical protein